MTGGGRGGEWGEGRLGGAFLELWQLLWGVAGVVCLA